MHTVSCLSRWAPEKPLVTLAYAGKKTRARMFCFFGSDTDSAFWATNLTVTDISADVLFYSRERKKLNSHKLLSKRVIVQVIYALNVDFLHYENVFR